MQLLDQNTFMVLQATTIQMNLDALQMAQTLYNGLCLRYPQHTERFTKNYETLSDALYALQDYGTKQLEGISCRELITFHDGFSCLADAFDLTILCAIEEESGSEASAQKLKELCQLIRSHNLNAVFTEKNGSCSAAQIIHSETGANLYELDMGLSGDSYFDAMYHNIDTLKEALE